MQLIDIQSVAIGYFRDKPLMDGISFSIARGDSIGILGPNGAGKSTLLKTLLGLVPPLGGRTVFPGGARPRLGYVPQGSRPDFAYPLSVLQVALMGRTPQLGLVRRPGRADRDLAMAQLAAVGLAHVAQAPFRSLSGGQQQRVLVARALTAEPDVLILDEPTSEMDPAAEHNLLSLVERLVSSRGIAVVFVTHEISAAAGFAESVILLDAAHHYFETGPATDMVTSERMTKLYRRPIEVRRENGRTLVWLSAADGGVSGSAPPPASPEASS